MVLPREDMLHQLEAVAGSDHVHLFDFKSLAVAAAGDAVYSNLVCLGVAYQKGLVPVSDQAIRQVISENYAPLEARGNMLAFEWGRRAAQDPDRVESLLGARGEGRRGGAAVAAAPAVESRQSGQRLVGDSAGARGDVARDGGGAIELENLVQIRVSRLHSYQDRAYAERYLSLVRKVHSIEGGLARAGDGGAGVAGEELEGDVASYPLTAAVAVNYYKVLAFKDEFEVSRLHLAYGPPLAQLAQEFEHGEAHVYTRARARTHARTYT
jgi:indolepyruvate ferredoxin oxidoreductase